MITVASVPYLFRRDDIFSFRRVVPRHLVHRLKRREIKVSLGTVDLSVARRRARTLANQFEEAIEMIENNLKLTFDEIDGTVRRYMQREWARSERDALDPGLDRAEVIEQADMGMEALGGMLKERSFNNSYVRGALKAAFGESTPPKGTSEYRHAANATLRADLESLRLRVAAILGEYRMPADPLFAGLVPERAEPHEAVPISQLLERWLAERKPKPRTEIEWRTAARRWIELHGDTDARAIDKRLVVQFKDALVRLPAAPKGKLYGLPMLKLLKRAPKGLPKLSPASVNKQLAAIKRLLTYAADNAIIETSPALGIKLAEKKNGGGKAREPLSAADISAALAGPVHAKGQRPEAGAGEFAYWAIPLGLFTGMRLGELGQLVASDVRAESGVHFIDVNEDGEDKSLKTPGSQRRVPVHPELVGLGFLAYVEERQKAGKDAALWPDLKPDCKGRATGNFSKWINRYLRAHGVTDRTKAFHSTRHSFKDRCREAGIDRDVHDALSGHCDGSVSGTYGNGYSLAALAGAMATVEYPGLTLPPKWSGDPAKKQ